MNTKKPLYDNINEDCPVCFEGHVEFDYDNCILYNEDLNEWTMYLETGNWDDSRDSVEFIETKVNYCYNCGRELR